MKSEKPTTGPLQKRVDRRAFVKGAGIAGIGIGGASWFAGKLGMLDALPGAKSLGLAPSTVQAADITDVDILNFALNLEYLEAEFYTVATTGRTIEQSGIAIDGTGQSGPTTGGKQVSFEADGQQAESSGKLRAVAEELAFDEQQHEQLNRGVAHAITCGLSAVASKSPK